MSDIINDLINNLVFTFEPLDWLGVMDLLLVTAIFFIILRWLRDNQAQVLLRGVFLLIALIGLLTSLEVLPAFSWLVRTTLPALLLAIPVIFAPEIRRALDRLGRAGSILDGGRTTSTTEIQDSISAIVSASARLADRRHGALVSIRVNPDIEPKTHPYLSTGLKQNKFGIDILRAPMAYRMASQLPNLKVVGIDCHVGSQLVEVEPIIEALRKLKGLVENLRKEGMDIEYLDLGGGLGITYEDEEPPHPVEYASTILDEVRGFDCTLALEPARVMVGNAGILATKVLYTKENEEKRFIIVDAGMNDLVRPSYYGSFHQILPMSREDREEIVADVVGPICESSDFLAKGRKIPKPDPGDFLAVMSAGAYGFWLRASKPARASDSWKLHGPLGAVSFSIFRP